MVALSLLAHGLFLYGVRLKSNALETPPEFTLRATIAPKQSASLEPKTQPPAETARDAPVAKIKPVSKKLANAKTKKTNEKKPTPETAIPEPIAKAPLPEPAPVLAPRSSPETKTEVAELSPAPPPVSAVERSGAKVRAPIPIENPTMPVDDVVATKTIEEPAPPIPPVAAAPQPIDPIAQNETPPARTEEIQSTETRAPLTKPSEIPREMPRELAPVAEAKPDVASPPTPEVTMAAPQSTVEPKLLPVPASGEAQYKLRMGIVSGELTLTWKFKDGHYQLDSVAQGSGLFAIAGKYIQSSEGDVTPMGLRPDLFSVERRGKKDSAAFNWADNSVHFNGKSGERQEVATPGTQDMLSLLFQLAFAPPLGDELTVVVTNGRKLERYTFERAGNEIISLEGGKFNTLKILKQRKGDEDGMEVWLAQEHHYLPVKIRVTDKKGSVIEQTLTSIKVVSAN